MRFPAIWCSTNWREKHTAGIQWLCWSLARRLQQWYGDVASCFEDEVIVQNEGKEEEIRLCFWKIIKVKEDIFFPIGKAKRLPTLMTKMAKETVVACIQLKGRIHQALKGSARQMVMWLCLEQVTRLSKALIMWLCLEQVTRLLLLPMKRLTKGSWRRDMNLMLFLLSVYVWYCALAFSG